MNTTEMTRMITPLAPVTLEQILEKLESIETRIGNIEELLETVDVRLSEIALDTGRGFEID